MFDISIEQKVLMKALEYLESTVGKNQNNLGDNCVSMISTGNGTLEMYTTNTLEFTKLTAIISSAGTTRETAPLVDFKRFKSVVASIPENEYISLKENGNDLFINFSLKPKPVKLVGGNNGMLSLPSQVGSSDMVSIPKTVMEHALNCACSVITDSVSAPLYNCIRVATDGSNVEITGLDFNGRRTFAINGTATVNNQKMDILLEASKFKKAMKMYEDFYEMEFYMGANTVQVNGFDPIPQVQQKTKGMITDISYFARRINGVYPPNIAQNFNPPPVEYIEINKEEMMASIARVKAIEDKTVSGDTIRFEANGTNVTISSTSSYGSVEDGIIAENSIMNQLAGMFKYSHFSDILKTIKTDTFEIGALPKHPSHFVIKEKGSNDVMYTIAGIAGQNASP